MFPHSLSARTFRISLSLLPSPSSYLLRIYTVGSSLTLVALGDGPGEVEAPRAARPSSVPPPLRWRVVVVVSPAAVLVRVVPPPSALLVLPLVHDENTTSQVVEHENTLI